MKTGSTGSPFILDVKDDIINPESFILISLLDLCLEVEIKTEGIWRKGRVPDWIHEGQGHPQCHA